MKKNVLSLFGVMIFAFATAQEAGKFRVGVDIGYSIPSSGGGGVLFSLEPKFNLSDRMNIGVRLGSAAMVRNIVSTTKSSDASLSFNGNYLATFDYYFRGNSSFVPYLAVGAGAYTLSNLQFSTFGTVSDNLDGRTKFGGLVQAGFEWGKFRLGMDYNLVPHSSLTDVAGVSTGTIKNSYLALHLGFYLGGGKWGSKSGAQ